MKERISVSSQIHFGKPCVAGTRISVQSVLELVREGLSFSQIIQDYYPDLDGRLVEKRKKPVPEGPCADDDFTASVCGLSGTGS